VDPVLVSPGEGEYVTRRAERDVAILCGFEQLTVTFSRFVPGERGPDPHVHRRHVDAFYVLDGEMTYTFGREDRSVAAGPGTFVLIPPGVVHTFVNESDGEVRWLNFHAPDAGFAQFLRDGSAWDSEGPPADGGLPADDALVAGPAAGELFDRADRTLLIKAQVAELSAIEIDFDPAFFVDPHRHADHVDAFWVIGGEVEFTVVDEPVVAGAGTFLAAPPGSRHGFRHPGGATRAKILNLHGPDAGFADSIRGYKGD
jgi:quercetin dioxygenase-like cupin family protein